MPISSASESESGDYGFLDDLLATIPIVKAMGIRRVDGNSEQLRLRAPLAANTNDKGCAFGGSLVSLMTLAAWGLVTLQLRRAGLAAEVYVQDSTVRYLAPVYNDLDAQAELGEDQDWAAFLAEFRERGKNRTVLRAQAILPDGRVAATFTGRFVALAARPA